MLHSLHRYLGLLLLVPLLTWVVTGAVFILQPGYRSAFESLSVATYPLEAPIRVRAQPGWQELRVVRTVLGEHLLVQDLDQRWSQLHPISLQPRPLPQNEPLQLLLDDALSHNRDRYGTVIAIERMEKVPASAAAPAPSDEPPASMAQEVHALTSTGVNLVLDWPTLSLRQSGADTEFINRLYSLHYLQWTPNALLNRGLAILALLGLLVLTLAGIRLFIIASNREREIEIEEERD